MKRMWDEDFTDGFLSQHAVRSDKLTDLKSKAFGKFSVNPASGSLFLHVGACCVIIRKAKEKPPETSVFPVV
jgi:hypothetical protein